MSSSIWFNSPTLFSLITKDLPPLQGLETKSDWNDIVKQQKEKSLSDFLQTAQAQVNKNHPPPKRERAMEL